MRRLFLVAALVAVAPSARADVTLHPLFSDHMVLQRGTDCPVWGTAAPGEYVEIALRRVGPPMPGAIRALATDTKADASGKWMVKIDTRKVEPGVDFTLSVINDKKEPTTVLKNVAVGDVWLCSGQSNMEWRLKDMPIFRRGQKAAAAATNPMIRLFDVPNRPFPTPQTTFPVVGNSGKWLECKPDTVINFSAVGYFFGRDIQASQKVPVGLIASDWGGTPAEAWTSLAGLKAESGLSHYAERIEDIVAHPEQVMEKYKAALDKWTAARDKAKEDGKPFNQRQPTKPQNGGVDQNTPTALYNGMIAPLLPFPIKGAIWYQGESNAGRAAEYRTLFPAMIADWRKQWGTDLPFFAVQLAPFRGGGSGVDYAELRDAQVHATKKLDKVGIAVITDVGDESDIHPQQKEPVGGRLALAARAIVYGEAIEYSGPTFKALKIDGDKAVVSFDHVGEGLVCDGGELAGFQVAGEDNVFKPAKAKIAGETVVVTSGDVAKPVAVRYGWVNFAKPTLNFFNQNGLPAVPFRTDDLPLTTAPKK